jgi:lipopolysaccharide transport system permease protein
MDLHMSEVWHYRDLLWLLVRRDFVSFYKQTILGPIWFFIQPLFTTIMYTFIFGSLAKIGTDGVPGPVFYMAGVTAWNYFADCITKTSTVFRDNANIFGKVYFPRLIMPVSVVISNLVRFAVQMILFLLTMAWFYWGKGNHSFHFTGYIVLFPVIVVLMGLLGLGLGMIVTALTTRYRDLALLVVFSVQLLMYGTTVVYPLSTVVAKYPGISRIIEYNPMTPIIETFRLGFLGSGTFSWGLFGYMVAVTLGLLFVSIIVFNRVEKNFVDTI